jgi:hypothetical protein
VSSAERYRRHATECLRIAQSSRDEEDRAVWIILAQAWARLAQHDEGRDEPGWSRSESRDSDQQGPSEPMP